MILEFALVHSGYLAAESPVTRDSYVVRTRPKNDGWMAIDDTDGIILATGLSLFDAERLCDQVDKQKAKEIFGVRA